MTGRSEAALSISPVGWKLLKGHRTLYRDWLLFLEGATYEFYEIQGWQLWTWQDLSPEGSSLLQRLSQEQPEGEYRLVTVSPQGASSSGSLSGPFDLMLMGRENGFSCPWIHIDLDYPSAFFSR